MIRAICYYTNQEEDEPSSLREQQHQCLEAVHDYGWVIHREVFDPFMKKVKIAQRSGMRTLLHEAAAHKFDLLVMMDKHFIGTCKEEAAVILMPRLPENLQGDHTNYVYPVNTQARTVLYRAIMKEYNRLQKNQELKKEAETLMRFKEKAVEEQNGTGDDRAAQWTGTDSSQNSGEHGAD